MRKCLYPSIHTLPYNARDGQKVSILHRFHNRVAVYLSPCEASGKNRKPSPALAYLTAREARALARALNKIAASIERESFGESQNTSFTIMEDSTQ